MEVGGISTRPDDLKMLVDIRENAKGTLQWVVLTAARAQTALGVHTWLEGYLSPVYREILEHLMGQGWEVASAKREKDGLMNFLTGAANTRAAIKTLGTGETLFPEFREVGGIAENFVGQPHSATSKAPSH